MPQHRGLGEELDPRAAMGGRVLIAAEWVGTLSSRGPQGDAVRFVPGGRVHAYDVATGLVLCGTGMGALELFWADFSQETTGIHCDECIRLAASRAGEPRVADA
jgi:hypothetical protein